MKTLFKLSEKVGLAPTVIGALVWLACGTGATIAIVDTLWQYPRLAFAFVMAVIVVAGVGGLIEYWLVADRIDFWRLGYQVKWLRKCLLDSLSCKMEDASPNVGGAMTLCCVKLLQN